MLRIRLRRTGRSKAPHYRVVIADQRAPRDGDFVEIVGHYNPRANPKELVLKEERIRHWLSEGARPSETVHRLLHREGLMEEPPPQRPTKESRAEREAAAAAAEPEAEAPAEAEAEAPAEAAAPAAAEPEAEAPAEAEAEAPTAEAEAPSEPAPEAEAPADEASEPEDPAEATNEPPDTADESEADKPGEAGEESEAEDK